MKKRFTAHFKTSLKNNRCPNCGGALMFQEEIDSNKCVTCMFSISEIKFRQFVGYKPRTDSNVFFVDGFVKGTRNPSPFGGGFVIADRDGIEIEKVTLDTPNFTNNEGEVRAIIRALEMAQEGDEIYTDSQIAEIWVKSGKSKARPDLLSEIERGNILMHQKKVYIGWVPRDMNLAGKIIEAHQDYNKAYK
jgi:ribonuclease HI